MKNIVSSWRLIVFRIILEIQWSLFKVIGYLMELNLSKEFVLWNRIKIFSIWWIISFFQQGDHLIRDLSIVLNCFKMNLSQSYRSFQRREEIHDLIDSLRVSTVHESPMFGSDLFKGTFLSRRWYIVRNNILVPSIDYLVCLNLMLRILN